MSNTKLDTQQKRNLIVGIVVVAIVILAMVLLFTGVMRGSAKQAGAIATQQEIRRGTAHKLVFEPKGVNVATGTEITWYADNQVIGKMQYCCGKEISVKHTPSKTGSVNYTVKVGKKYYQNKKVEILPPLLTVKVNDVTVTYGEKIPQPTYTVSGFVDGDNAKDFNLDNCPIKCDGCNVGTYKIDFCKLKLYKDYQMKYIPGQLKILPRELTVTNKFIKTYDQTNLICNPQITLDGVLQGDDVSAQCSCLCLDNKNVGTSKVVDLSTIVLTGKHAQNYVIKNEATATVLPKPVYIVGLQVQNKKYDGTNNAQVKTLGTLGGVFQGDNVAIGQLELNFDDANAGTQGVNVSKVTLVGSDKDNYVLTQYNVPPANIQGGLLDKIINKQPIIEG